MNSSSSTATSTVAESFQSSWPPTGEAEDARDWRRAWPATVRSSGNQPGTFLLAGASGDQGTGAGEDGKTGEPQERLECLELASDRWRSSRRRRESGEGKEIPAVASGGCSRPRQSWSRPAFVV